MRGKCARLRMTCWSRNWAWTSHQGQSSLWRKSPLARFESLGNNPSFIIQFTNTSFKSMGRKVCGRVSVYYFQRANDLSRRIQTGGNSSGNLELGSRRDISCLRPFSQRRQFPNPECYSTCANETASLVPSPAKCDDERTNRSDIDPQADCWTRSSIGPRDDP